MANNPRNQQRQSDSRAQGRRALSRNAFVRELGTRDARAYIERTPGWNLDVSDREATFTFRDRFLQSATVLLPLNVESVATICELVAQYRAGTLIASSAKSSIEAAQVQQLVDDEHLRRRGFPREGRYQDS